MSANVAGVAEETTGERVRRRRMTLGLSLRQLAAEAGVDRVRISKMEKDEPVSELVAGRVLATLDRLDRFHGVDNPDEVVNVIEVDLADGRTVRATFPAGPIPENMDEVVARLVARLESGERP